MSRRIIVSLLFILALTFMISCSGGDGNIITPEPVTRDNVAAEATGGTLNLGLWQVVIDTKTGTGDIVQLRSADKIINVLGFMEPPPLTLMDLDWANLVIDDPIIEVGVILTHPLSGDDVFTGFDVRGVCFGPDVTNADGLTVVTSPEYFKGVPFGYQDGLLGAPDSIANYGGLAGYKYFCDGLNATEDLADFFTDTGNVDDRGSYGSGQTNQRDYILDWTDSDESFFIFNYSIYANYDWPVGGTDLDDFDIETANSAESFACKVTELANSLYFATGFGGGGTISLQIEAWDWQGDISQVTIESVEGGIIAQTPYDVALGVFPSGASYGYEFYAVPGTPTETGDLDILITVTDTKTFGECWFLDLLPTSNSMYDEKLYNCFLYTTTVIECPPATVTSIDPDGGWGGQSIDDAVIDGAFIDGTSLAVKLTMTGETDIVADDVTFVDSATITCDLDLTGAAVGDWTVVVTNGCGVDGELVDGFEVQSCGSLTCPSGAPTTMIGTPRLYYFPPQPVMDANTRIIVAYRSYAWCTINWTGTSMYDVTYNSPSYSMYETAITTDDRVYYRDSGSSNRIYYCQYGPPFTNMRTTWGTTLPASRYVHRLSIDEDDNPIVLARYSLNAEVYHWNGTDWGSAITIPGAGFGNNYSYIQDFDYDPSTGYYYIVERYNTAGVHAYDSTGTLVWENDPLWTQVTGTYWEPGIFIDKQDPECRMILMAGRNTSNQTTYWARFNPVGGQKTTGTTYGGTYGSLFSTFQGEGCIQTVGSTSRFLASTYGGNVWSSTIVPSW